MTRLLLVLALYFQVPSPGSQIEVPLVVGEGQSGRAFDVISISVIAVPFEGTPLHHTVTAVIAGPKDARLRWDHAEVGRRATVAGRYEVQLTSVDTLVARFVVRDLRASSDRAPSLSPTVPGPQRQVQPSPPVPAEVPGSLQTMPRSPAGESTAAAERPETNWTMVGMVVTAVGIVVAAFVTVGVAGWQRWTSIRDRVRQAIQAAKPQIDYHVGSYGGAGVGLNPTVTNSGSDACNLKLFAPTFEKPIWTLNRLARGNSVSPMIPIPDEAEIRTTAISNGRFVLQYEDIFCTKYSASISLEQQPRDDGRFNLGSNGPIEVTAPPLTRRRIWQLKELV